MNKEFVCTSKTVDILYNTFDKICEDKEVRDIFLRGRSICLYKDLDEKTRYFLTLGYDGEAKNTDKELYNLDMSSLKGEGIDTKGDTFNIDGIDNLYLDTSYLFNKSDVLRLSDGLGISGRYSCVSDTTTIFYPSSLVIYRDVCEPREEYGLDYGFTSESLPDYFHNILDNMRYVKACRSMYAKDKTLLFIEDKLGSPFVNFLGDTRKYLYDLREGSLERKFYEDLLECIVRYCDKVSKVSIYTDMRWTKILKRPSLKVEGEYEIVIK